MLGGFVKDASDGDLSVTHSGIDIEALLVGT
jgi:hypothetical protein